MSGEYLILRGARGLALPTSRGQHLTVSTTADELLVFEAQDEQGQVWFNASFARDGLAIKSTSSETKAEKLQALLQAIQKFKPEVFSRASGFHFLSKLDFPRNWGLGSSSTLVNNMAQWAEIDAFTLSESSFGGSGYDVVTAQENQSILFSRGNSTYETSPAAIHPDVQDHIHFIHLGVKQDSAVEVARFADINVSERDIDEITRLSEEMATTNSLVAFERCIERHEILTGRILSTESASERFADYSQGRVKYLGAWGGDFMLATGDSVDMDYFKAKGYHTILSYNTMIAL